MTHPPSDPHRDTDPGDAPADPARRPGQPGAQREQKNDTREQRSEAPAPGAYDERQIPLDRVKISPDDAGGLGQRKR